ncbi:uncharacterized protein LOC62_06G008599 [Vanrija pseudolonga]|uniref:Uncharacterized protein n=1 Tax=Vanrija pseudolonga TaxID=143232 RepID=A0AAF0YI91_9TREE|nr:hypothetical protein LOC62_06G008599 [Vanrija pseudolonga]
MSAPKSQRVAPLLAGDETKYKRRYRGLKELVNELSDESNLLALRVHLIQRRLYDHHMERYGRPPAPMPVPADASWAPLVQNAATYPEDTGKPVPPMTPPQKRAALDNPASNAPSAPPSPSSEAILDAAGLSGAPSPRERERERDRDRDSRDREPRESHHSRHSNRKSRGGDDDDDDILMDDDF